MVSIDALTAAIRNGLEQTRDLISGLAASRQQATAVRDHLGALGIENNAAQAEATVDRLEEGQAKGGRLAGTGRPGKTEFPPDWDMEEVREALEAVATRPELSKPQANGKWAIRGIYKGVTIDAVIRPDGSIEAGWSVSGPGVRKNPAPI